MLQLLHLPDGILAQLLAQLPRDAQLRMRLLSQLFCSRISAILSTSPTFGSAAARDSTADFACPMLSSAFRTGLGSSLASAAALESKTRTGHCVSACLLWTRFSRWTSFVPSLWPRRSQGVLPSSCLHRDLRPTHRRTSSGSPTARRLRGFHDSWPARRKTGSGSTTARRLRGVHDLWPALSEEVVIVVDP